MHWYFKAQRMNKLEPNKINHTSILSFWCPIQIGLIFQCFQLRVGNSAIFIFNVFSHHYVRLSFVRKIMADFFPVSIHNEQMVPRNKVE